jgi:hypothetical protein
MSLPVTAPNLDYDQRRFDLMVTLRTLAGEAGIADKNAYLRIGGKSTLEPRLIKAIEAVDTLIKEIMYED